YSFTAEVDRNLVANFVLQSISITATANPIDGGNITGEGNHNYNTTAELTATPNNGYSFVNWTEDGDEVSINQKYTFVAQANRDLVANFTIVNSIQNLNKENNKLLLFPNPAKDVLTIQILDNKKNDNPVLISLINSEGKTIQVEYNNSSDGIYKISLANIPAGIYLIDVRIDHKLIGKDRVLIVK
ncbi:MAG TPA: T9SS type A sorting domain-containing protein, partial [Bacteroidales bacterium]|nr:T9SS type A sorting domain-containing protein [Bacteroidales bacterium]